MTQDLSKSVRMIFEGREYRALWDATGALVSVRHDGKAINPTNKAYKAISEHSEALRTGALPDGFADTSQRHLLRVKSRSERVKSSRQRAQDAGAVLTAPFVLPADAVRDIELLMASGYANSRNACFLRAIKDAAAPLNKLRTKKKERAQ